MRVTRYACLDAARRTRRRLHHENKAAAMRSEMAQAGDDEMTGEAPLVDEALDRLSKADRALVVMAYYQERSHEEIAAQLGIGREAAHKRVQRAVGRLRSILTKRGMPAAREGGFAGALAALRKPAAAPAAVSAAVMSTLGGQVPALVEMIAKGTMIMLKVVKATTSALMLAAVGVVVAAVALAPVWGQSREGATGRTTQPGNPSTGDLKLVPGVVAPMPLPGRGGTVAGAGFPGQVQGVFATNVTQLLPRSTEALSGRKPWALDLDKQQLLPAVAPEEMQAIMLPFAVERWMAEHGGDVRFDGAAPGRGLVGIDMAILPTEDVTVETAERATPAEIVALLAQVGPSSMAVVSTRTLPATYFVQTREGGIGILELASVARGGDSPTGTLMVQYRMMTTEARGAGGDGHGGDGAAIVAILQQGGGDGGKATS